MRPPRGPRLLSRGTGRHRASPVGVGRSGPGHDICHLPPHPWHRGRVGLLRRGRAVVLLVSVALVVGCSGGSDRPRSAEPSASGRTVTARPDPLPPGVALSFVQQRFDEGTRRAGVRVTNGRDGRAAGAFGRHRLGGLPAAAEPGRLRRAGPQRGGSALPAASTPTAPPPRAAARRPGWPSCARPAGPRTLRRPVDAEGRRFLLRLWRSDVRRPGAESRGRGVVRRPLGARPPPPATGSSAALDGALRAASPLGHRRRCASTRCRARC